MRRFALACFCVMALQARLAWSATPLTPCVIDGQISRHHDSNGDPYLAVGFSQQMLIDRDDPTEVGIYCTVHSNKYDLTNLPFYQITNLMIMRNGVEANELHILDVTYMTGDKSPSPSGYLEVSARFFPPLTITGTGTSPYVLHGVLCLFDTKK